MNSQATADRRIKTWLGLALAYFATAVSLGVFMGASGDHSLFPVHAHLNLLGWVSMTLTALIYRQFPQSAARRLGQAHLWLYGLSLPVMMLALAGKMKGVAGVEPVLGAASVLVGIAVLLFVGGVLAELLRAPQPARDAAPLAASEG